MVDLNIHVLLLTVLLLEWGCLLEWGSLLNRGTYSNYPKTFEGGA